jgi:hypothetical protein
MRRWSVRQQQVGCHAAAAPILHKLPRYSHHHAAVQHPLLRRNMPVSAVAWTRQQLVKNNNEEQPFQGDNGNAAADSQVLMVEDEGAHLLVARAPLSVQRRGPAIGSQPAGRANRQAAAAGAVCGRQPDGCRGRQLSGTATQRGLQRLGACMQRPLLLSPAQIS